jgi:hydrogenase nickel incorporation protein HypA/HybF
MHEFSLIKDLLHKVTTTALTQQATRVRGIKVKLGALSHISPDHFREHFIHAARGTVAESAELIIEVMTDADAPFSQEMLLEYIEI